MSILLLMLRDQPDFTVIFSKRNVTLNLFYFWWSFNRQCYLDRKLKAISSKGVLFIHQISLQQIRQNHWTMEYRSQWPTLILRSNVGSYWFILPKYDVHTSNSLLDIRKNHWTVKYRCCWPSLHDPQVHVTRLSHVRPTIYISWFRNRKVEKHL